MKIQIRRSVFETNSSSVHNLILCTKEQWDKFYMGDDGQFTMYVDLVNGVYAKNSTSKITYPLSNNIVEMFKVVKNEKSS